jgi:hypothetical protein
MFTKLRRSVQSVRIQLSAVTNNRFEGCAMTRWQISLRRLLVAIGLLGLAMACMQRLSMLTAGGATAIPAVLLFSGFAVLGCAGLGALVKCEWTGAIIGVGISIAISPMIFAGFVGADV